jgi:hypothetical protein
LLQACGPADEKTSAPKGEPEVRPARAKILVVDADSDVREFLTVALRELGFEPFEAPD